MKFCKSLRHFLILFERIQKRPEFKGYKSDNIYLSQFDMEELKRVSSKASVYLEKIADTAIGIISGAFINGGINCGSLVCRKNQV